MDTLVNASSHRPEEAKLTHLPRNGFTPAATADSQTKSVIGVSIKNILDPHFRVPENLRWWALRVTYGRELYAKEQLGEMGILAYVPTHKVERRIDNKVHREERSLLPNIVFVLASDADVETLVSEPLRNPEGRRKDLKAVSLRYTYDNTLSDVARASDRRITIPHSEMTNFIRFTLTGSEQIRTVEAGEFRIKSGEMVEVSCGELKGVQGRVVRIGRQTCLLVDLRPLCLLASAYIPKGWLRPLKSVDDKAEIKPDKAAEKPDKAGEKPKKAEVKLE